MVSSLFQAASKPKKLALVGAQDFQIVLAGKGWLMPIESSLWIKCTAMMIIYVNKGCTYKNFGWEGGHKACIGIALKKFLEWCLELKSLSGHTVDKVCRCENGFTQKFLGTFMVNIIDLATSRRCLFFRSATPFC